MTETRYSERTGGRQGVDTDDYLITQRDVDTDSRNERYDLLHGQYVESRQSGPHTAPHNYDGAYEHSRTQYSAQRAAQNAGSVKRSIIE